jgi:hypothetical protein
MGTRDKFRVQRFMAALDIKTNIIKDIPAGQMRCGITGVGIATHQAELLNTRTGWT